MAATLLTYLLFEIAVVLETAIPGSQLFTI